MTVPVWRIAAETPAYAANDLSGAGAKISGGRWNNKRTPVVYCASTIALAVLETVQALRSGDLPFNRYLVRVDVPNELWDARARLDPPPAGWDAVPAGLASRHAGERWVASAAAAVLQVPSVIVPDEFNILINPRHPAAAVITATTLKRWIFDPRLFP